MDAQIASETGSAGTDSRTSNQPSPGANSEALELLNRSIKQVDELSARIAEIERHIANQRPDAEKFANEIGPIVLATRNLREEISQHKDEMKRGLESHRKEVAATLKQIVEQVGQHRTNIGNDISQVEAIVGTSYQMVQESQALSQQSMTVYTKATKAIEDVSLKATRHVEKTAQNAGQILDEQTEHLTKSVREMETMYYRMREWLITKTIVIAMMSALVGALVGGLMIGLYTMRRIDAVAEVQLNSEKWKFLVERQSKKNPQDGEAINRQIEREMEEQEKGGTQDTNK